MIGPSFAKELVDAGIDTDGIHYFDDGRVIFVDSISQATKDKVAIVLAAHDPLKPAPLLSLNKEESSIKDLWIVLDPASTATVQEKTDAKARLDTLKARN